MTLQDILSLPELNQKLLNEAKSLGFITSMASAPHVLSPQDWLPFLWGGNEVAPFTDGQQLEQFAEVVIELWNHARPALLEGTWQWPEMCQLDDKEIVNEATRDFCEGMLHGWQLARDDWESLMPEHSEDNALLGGVLLSISMLFDPEASIKELAAQGIEDLDQFTEIFNAIPVMLNGLTQRGALLAEQA